MKISPSTKTGSHHWILQRLSAIFLIPLIIWLVLSFLKIVQDPDYIAIFFVYPLNTFLAVVFIAVSLYHGSLGMRVIIEDYVPNKFQKHFYIIVVNFTSIVAGVGAVISIIKLHMVG
jgi:succinate dehydrogenase / fumarate reductase membrane anchor subunit